MSSSELLYLLLCSWRLPHAHSLSCGRSDWGLTVSVVELVLACLARTSSTYCCAVEDRQHKQSPKRSPSSTASPKRSPPSPRKKTRILLLPSFPFYIVVNHILEYVSVIFSNVESFALKALVAINCGLRFNGSIVLKYVCKALSNLLSCCLMIWKLFVVKWCYELSLLW